MKIKISFLLVISSYLACFFTPTTAGFYSASDGVVELTPTNFDKQVINDDAIWVVEFYAPWCGHCQSLTPEYKKLAKALKGIAKVGAVDADEHKSLGSQYGVRGFPTIKIFGANKRSPVDFNGERNAKGMANAALDEIRKKLKENLGGGSSSSGGGGSSGSSDVIELTDDNFDKLVLDSDDVWLVEFFAPWCGHCKNLAPEWEKAATELKGKVKLGALDATAHESKARDYDVRGYPTIKFFAGGKKSRNDAQEYGGGRTASDIVAWALEKFADSVPAPELVEIVDAASFETTCDNKPLCVISFLPHILDCNAKCRNEYLQILRDLSEQYKQKLWGWAWTEGFAQTDLEQALEVGGFGYPAMAVANFKKMKFSLLKGSFSKDGINEFLRDISYGRGQTGPVRGAKLPNIVSVEAWNGKDGELPQDEDLDLSDINLDDTKDEL